MSLEKGQVPMGNTNTVGVEVAGYNYWQRFAQEYDNDVSEKPGKRLLQAS